MNKSELVSICKKESHKAYDSFKHYIKHALFPLTESIIQIELNTMVQSIGRGVNGKMFICPSNPKQYQVKESIVNYYIGVTQEYAVRFAKSQL